MDNNANKHNRESRRTPMPLKIAAATMVLTVAYIAASERSIESIRQDVSQRQSAIAERSEIAQVEWSARMAQQLESIRPSAEYRGNLFIEGQIVPGELTFYCDCKICCGPKAKGITKDGTVLSELTPDDYPVVGANWLPLGSLVRVEGTTYRIADQGGSGLDRVGRLDVYTPEGHAAALELGRVKGIDVEIVRIGE